jgi:predicted lipoprotein with Yx(FWY)xxD motif
MKPLIVLTTALTAIVLAAVPASSYGGSDTSGMQTARATVAIASSPLGKILVDGEGRTLYDFPPDKSMASTCYGACAALWPPLITSSKPAAGKDVRASLLGTTKRKDGKLEVTYNHHPLYYFVSDQKAGQTTGQGVDQFGAPWWVLSPAGKEIHRG